MLKKKPKKGMLSILWSTWVYTCPYSLYYSCKIHTTCNKLQWYYLTSTDWSCFHILHRDYKYLNSSFSIPAHTFSFIFILILSLSPPFSPFPYSPLKKREIIFRKKKKLIPWLMLGHHQPRALIPLPLRCSGTTPRDAVGKPRFHF